MVNAEVGSHADIYLRSTSDQLYRDYIIYELYINIKFNGYELYVQRRQYKLFITLLLDHLLIIVF